MINSYFFLSWLLLLSPASFVTLNVTKIVSAPLKTGLMARRLEKYALLPADSWITEYELGFVEYYAAVVEIGSPHPQRQSLVIDTSNSMSYVACTGCPPAECNNHEDPNFMPERSDSFRWEDCPDCRGGKYISCSPDNTCKFNMEHEEQQGASGRMFSDMVDFGWGAMQLEIGCAQKEFAGAVTDNADGLLGVGVDDECSVSRQIGEQLHHTEFAHCFKSTGEGTVIFGDWEKPEKMIWTPMRTEGIKYYKTTVLSVHVGNKMISSDTRL